MKTFNPWTYPVGFLLSNNANLQHIVEQLIHENVWQQNDKPKVTSVSKRCFTQFLRLFQKKLTNFNAATKAIAGHKLQSLQWISNCIHKILSNLQYHNEKNLIWKDDDKFKELLFGDKAIKLKHWQLISHPCLESLLFQSLKTIAEIIHKKLDEEAICILTKRLYLLEKVRYNLTKTTPRHLQQEQISIIPWSVLQPDWSKAAKFIKQQSIKMRNLKQIDLSRIQTDISVNGSTKINDLQQKYNTGQTIKNNFYSKSSCVDIVLVQDAQLSDSNYSLWNASKMLSAKEEIDPVK